MIRVATWCAMMWDGVESACYHRARGGLVRVCVRVVGRARGRKNQMKKSLCVWDSCATREREREREMEGENESRDATAICTSYCPREE